MSLATDEIVVRVGTSTRCAHLAFVTDSVLHVSSISTLRETRSSVVSSNCLVCNTTFIQHNLHRFVVSGCLSVTTECTEGFCTAMPLVYRSKKYLCLLMNFCSTCPVVRAMCFFIYAKQLFDQPV
uniref:Uncharacterized protein n=1 Tax=Rhipicephalus microplus TaxID=6941 RepID=A0A6G5AI33_RHIMP